MSEETKRARDERNELRHSSAVGRARPRRCRRRPRRLRAAPALLLLPSVLLVDAPGALLAGVRLAAGRWDADRRTGNVSSPRRPRPPSPLPLRRRVSSLHPSP